jgi:hypothetical protein
MNDSMCATIGDFFEETPGRLKRMVGFAGLLAANGALLLTITGFALLKEDPMFWRNAGGWPIWLRETVKFTFYPLLASELLVLLALSACVFGSRTLASLRRRTLPLTGLMWMWAGSVVMVVIGNNIANLLTGRPLHWHPY